MAPADVWEAPRLLNHSSREQAVTASVGHETEDQPNFPPKGSTEHEASLHRQDTSPQRPGPSSEFQRESYDLWTRPGCRS